MTTEIHEQTKVYGVLLTAARARVRLSYDDIGRAGGFNANITAGGMHAGDLLDCITKVEYAQGRPMLGAIVVKTDGKIGGGFFKLADELGRLPLNASEAARAAFVKSEQAAVFDAWAS